MKTLIDTIDPELRKLLQGLESQLVDHAHSQGPLSKNENTNRISKPSFRIDIEQKNIPSTEYVKSQIELENKDRPEWNQREAKDKGWALKCFCANNILLAKNTTERLSYTSVNGQNKLFIQSPDGQLPYGPAIKIILWICDQVFKSKSLDISQNNLKGVLEQLGMCYHSENRKMFLQVLGILQRTSFCYTENKKITTGNFRIVESFSYKDDPKFGNKLILKVTSQFLELFNNTKFVRAFDYEVIRQIGCDYTSIHFYLFSLQRTFKKGPDAHIKIQEFLNECGSTFQDSMAFFRKIKDVVIPKLTSILEKIYGGDFHSIFETQINTKTKIGRIIIKMGKLLLPKKVESLKQFLKRCCQLLISHGILAREKLSQEDREGLHKETGRYLEDLVKMSPQQLQKMLLI